MADRGLDFDSSYDENDQETPESAAKRILCERLMSRWNEIHNAQEAARFSKMSAIEDGFYDEPEFDTDEEAAAYHQKRKLEAAALQMEVAMLEEQINKLGGRIMRPYEHWGPEEERLVEYLETRYDYEYKICR